MKNNSRKVAYIKATHGSKILPNVKTQIANLTLCMHGIPQG